MRAPRLAVAACALALVAGGCGGASVTVPEVPGEPVSLTVPGNTDVLAPDATVTPGAASGTADTGTDPESTASTSGTAATTATPTPTATAAAPAGGTTGTTGTTDPADATTGGATTGDDTTGGTSAGAGGEDTTTTDSPPPAGSDVQKFEEFCAQNPGAC